MAKTKKLFSSLTMVFRAVPAQVFHSVNFSIFDSKQELIGALTELLNERYPREDGYYNHLVDTLEIPLLDAFLAAGYTKKDYDAVILAMNVAAQSDPRHTSWPSSE